MSLELDMRVLSLDVSTTFIGVCILDDTNIVMLDHIEFNSKCKTLWAKADNVKEVFESWVGDERFVGLERVFIEDAAKRFTPGMSSAETIGTLLRFNGLTSYLVHEIFKLDPEYIPVGAARKLCGLQMKQKKNAGGRGHKEQTYDTMMATDLNGTKWPTKKSGQLVDWRFDVADAYVIAKAGVVAVSTGTPLKKPRKNKKSNV